MDPGTLTSCVGQVVSGVYGWMKEAALQHAHQLLHLQPSVAIYPRLVHGFMEIIQF